MGRPGLTKHPKFRRLAKMLKCPLSHARGYLEMMWDVTYEQGNPVIGDAMDIEMAAEYKGDAWKLFKALIECGGPGAAGFIEQCPSNPLVYQVHDLFENAPDYVQRRHRRNESRKHKHLQQICPVGGGKIPSVTAYPSPAQPSPAHNPPTPLNGKEVWEAMGEAGMTIYPKLDTGEFRSAWLDWWHTHYELKHPSPASFRATCRGYRSGERSGRRRRSGTAWPRVLSASMRKEKTSPPATPVNPQSRMTRKPRIGDAKSH